MSDLLTQRLVETPDADLMGDFHGDDVVRSQSTGAQMVVHHDGDPWSARYYELVDCPHQDEES